MLSVIIATLDSERPLVRTLATLVAGALDGLVSEVLVADAGSRDETAEVADAAGCNFITVTGPPGRRLLAASRAARAPWLLFLHPGIGLEASWVADVTAFMQETRAEARAATFRRGTGTEPALRNIWRIVTSAVGGPDPAQGLLISQQFYRILGGHSDSASDPEAELLRRIGRARLSLLATGASAARLDT
jgi:glycosyltransferase involved in cell wall biosynthesis